MVQKNGHHQLNNIKTHPSVAADHTCARTAGSNTSFGDIQALDKNTKSFVSAVGNPDVFFE